MPRGLQVYHGLRLKAGLDCGKLKGEINCVTGRMVRTGRGAGCGACVAGRMDASA